MNKIFRCLPVLAALLAVAGCSTTESRIRSQQALFDSWPADIQQKIRVRHIDLGFTAEMVRIALGEADRVYSRSGEKGPVDVWVYLDHGPKFSFGVGVGGVNGNTAYGGGLALGDDVFRENEILRVIFEGGRVSAIETRRK